MTEPKWSREPLLAQAKGSAMNPNGIASPTHPIDTVTDTLSSAQTLARRVNDLHDALLGACDLPQVAMAAGDQSLKSGVLNDVQQYGRNVRSMIYDASAALERIEEALGIHGHALKEQASEHALDAAGYVGEQGYARRYRR